MPSAKKITLMWYAKTEKPEQSKDGKPKYVWIYFPALFKNQHGSKEARHGVVIHNGKEVEYPSGRYVLRSYNGGRKVYTPIETCNPRDAVIAFDKAKKAALESGPARNPKLVIKTAVPAYIKDCKSRQKFEMRNRPRSP